MKRVTIKDVAARAGVSFATVSRVLDDRPEISGATKERVRAACNELGYVPNIAARGLVKKNTKTIGLVVTDISNPYFSGIANAVEETARKNGYRVLLCNSYREQARETAVLDSLLRQQIDGLIISPVSPDTQKRLEAIRGIPPLVYLGNNHDGHCSYVMIDNKRGAYEGTRYLICLGHREIAYVAGRADSMIMHHRHAGYLQAMREAGLEGRIYPCAVGDNSPNRNYDIAKRVLTEGPLPTAIFAYSDRAAYDVMRVADERGIRIPEDLSLIGFDNLSYSALPRINLTSVSQHKYELGRIAVARLLDKIGGDAIEHHDVLAPELIIRTTCRKL